MSTENEVSLEKFLSTRAHTKVPGPWRRTRMPSLTSAIKGDFARRARLRGVMIWVLGEDDQENSLLNALITHLKPARARQSGAG